MLQKNESSQTTCQCMFQPQRPFDGKSGGILLFSRKRGFGVSFSQKNKNKKWRLICSVAGSWPLSFLAPATFSESFWVGQNLFPQALWHAWQSLPGCHGDMKCCYVQKKTLHCRERTSFCTISLPHFPPPIL